MPLSSQTVTKILHNGTLEVRTYKTPVSPNEVTRSIADKGACTLHQTSPITFPTGMTLPENQWLSALFPI